MKKIILLLSVTVITVSLDSTAAIYKWVDAKGVTHYSDDPSRVPDNHQIIDDAMPPVHSMQRPDSSLTRTLEAGAEQRRQRPRQGQRAPEMARQITPKPDSRCASLKRQLTRLQSQLRRGYREPRGNKLREKRRELQTRLGTECE